MQMVFFSDSKKKLMLFMLFSLEKGSIQPIMYKQFLTTDLIHSLVGVALKVKTR